MVITWLDFEEFLLETFIFFNNFGCVFSRSKTIFGHISGKIDPIDVKRKGSASVGYWVKYVILTFDLTHDLDFGCFKVKFRNISLRNCWSDWCEIIMGWVNMILGWLYDLPLWPHPWSWSWSSISRSESQEWDGRLTWNKKDVSHPFMTMTSVTMVGWWVDLPDRDWGDFRRRRAIDISSFDSSQLQRILETNILHVQTTGAHWCILLSYANVNFMLSSSKLQWWFPFHIYFPFHQCDHIMM